MFTYYLKFREFVTLQFYLSELYIALSGNFVAGLRADSHLGHFIFAIIQSP